jgi:signal transduction histidine kinase
VSNYIAFLHGGIEGAGVRPLEDGNVLARQCLDKLQECDNPEQFPPKLLFLLISVGYLERKNHLDEIRARQLIAGIRQSFFEAGHRDIPLIGSSVAAIFYDCEIHHEGALLVCLASRLLDVTVSMATNVSRDADAAAQALIDGLDIEHSLNEYPRSLPNRLLLTFFPGTGTTGLTANNSTDKLHTLLLEKLNYQIPIVGGVSSANDPKRRKHGLQLVNQQTFTDALAACLIRSGLPLATSMAKGLESTGEILHVGEVSKDEQFIVTFDNGRRPEDIFKGQTKPILLRDYSSESNSVRAKWLPDSNPGEVIALRDVRPNSALEVTTPSPQKIYKETRAAHELSLRRARIENPAGCLSFKCSGHLSYRAELKLDLPSGIKAMQEAFGIPHYVGGFYDGEIGTDAAGAFTCGGWSIAALIFGDELSERTAVQGGFSTLATHGLALTASFDFQEALKQSLELVYDLGFQGAMLSIMMRDHNPDLLPKQSEGVLVPMSAKGPRFNKVLQIMRREGINGEIPPEVTCGDKPVFISHASSPAGTEREVFREAGIINEYVLPLRDSKEQIFALLRVDIGDQEGEKIHDAVKGVLSSVSAIVGAALSRISNWQENQIARKLDYVLKKSMSADSIKDGLQQFIEGALNAFGLANGYIRLVNPAEHFLKLEAGQGAYFEAAMASRSEVSFEDWSPSCEAFIQETTTIINDAPNNIAHQRMCDKYGQDPRMSAALKSLGSYANVSFKNEAGDRLGTINLLSNESWFFNDHRERALASLSRRVGFLVENLKNKEETRNIKRRAEEALQKVQSLKLREDALARQLSFVKNVGKTLDLIPGLERAGDDICNLLNFATSRFCQSLRAYAAALYLWDEEQQQYILRAQSGWKDENWVHAARYRRTDNWIGTKGLADKPRYVQDLFQYYQERNYSEPMGRYAKQIFGEHLSSNFTVEAIAAPLRSAGQQFGVLTLYGEPNPQGALRHSQFQTTTISTLEEAIGRFGGLVSVLLSSQSAAEERLASVRRVALFDSIHQNQGQPFEIIVCESIAEHFAPSQVEFFKVRKSGQPDALLWVHGIEVSPLDAQHKTLLKMRQADEFIKRSARTELILSRRIKARSADDIEPSLAVTEGMIERCVIPLIGRGKLSGVIDISWDTNRLAERAAFNFFSHNELDELAKMLGSLYAKQRIILELDEAKKQEEKSRQVVDSLDGLFGFSVHRIRSLIGILKDQASEISGANPSGDVTTAINGLIELINEEIPWIEELVAAAESGSASKEQHPLADIVDEAVSASQMRRHAPKIELVLDLPEGLTIYVNEKVVRETIAGVIKNSIEAMHDGGVVTITASAISADDVKIILSDTGPGMSEEEIEKLNSEYTTKKGHLGLGIRLSKATIPIQGGRFVFSSRVNEGTRVEITLPARQPKE